MAFKLIASASPVISPVASFSEFDSAGVGAFPLVSIATVTELYAFGYPQVGSMEFVVYYLRYRSEKMIATD